MSHANGGVMLRLSSDREGLADKKAHEFSLVGKTLVADASGALYWPGERLLIVADLHLEKGSSAAPRGFLLPPYDTRETLIALAGVIELYDPATVVALGDSFHDAGAEARISADDVAALHILQEGRRWIWITGNHDPEIPARFGGEIADDIEVSGLTLRHTPTPAPATHEIAGHMHPAACVSLFGYSVRRPCFVGNGRRIVVPAFGAFTGGLNVLDRAFEPLFGVDGMQVIMLGQDGVYPVATRLLRGD